MRKKQKIIFFSISILFLSASVCCANHTDSLAFFQMIRDGTVWSLQGAIDQGFEINRNYGIPIESRSPLHEAIWMTRPDVVRLLIHNGANLELRDHVENTPIFTAVIIATAPKNRPEIEAKKKSAIVILESLIAAGANVNAFDLTGNTPLAIAAGGWDRANVLSVARKLLEAGADPNLTDGDRGMPPIFWLLAQEKQENEDGLAFQRADTLQLLLDAGADPNHCLQDGTTPLSLAVFSKKAVNLLEEAGAKR